MAPPAVTTTLFAPPFRGSNLTESLERYLLTLQMLLPFVAVDTTTGNQVLHLPAAGLNAATGQSNQNAEYTYRKTSADGNTVTIKGSIDGPQVLATNVGAGSVVKFKSDGTDWWVSQWP